MASPDVEVRLEDQLKINEFGRLASRLDELRGDLKAAKDRYENMSDATDEVALAGDEEGNIKLAIGEAFVDTDEDNATEFVEKLLEEEKGKIARMEEEVGTIESRQDELKKDLYARFGSSINLDE